MNPPPPTASPGGQESSHLALASLILGIIGIVLCLGVLAGIPAIICGHMARFNIKHAGGAVKGDGFAIAGLITGYISIAITFLLFLLVGIVTLARFVVQHGRGGVLHDLRGLGIG